jgi:hypothetical protein
MPLSSLHELYLQIMRSRPERNRILILEVLEDIMAFELEYIVFANYGHVKRPLASLILYRGGLLELESKPFDRCMRFFILETQRNS